MSIDSALYARLAGFAGLSALVSARIYPPPIPQDPTYPLVTYQQVSGNRGYVYGPNQDGFVWARFQLDSWAETLIGARALSEQVRLALSNYHGTSDSVVIDYIRIESEQQLFEEDVEKHRISQDYFVWFRESLPA